MPPGSSVENFRGPDRPPGVLSRTYFRGPDRSRRISVGSFRGPETASKSKGLHRGREREERERESECECAVAAKSVQTLRISNASNRYEFGCFHC
jgi:hypothetical protein